VDDVFGFFDFVAGAVADDGLAGAACGAEDFVDAFGVVLDEGVGDLEDVFGGAVVFLQFDHAAGVVVGEAVAEVGLEVEEDAEVGGAEGVDGLINVADDEGGAVGPVFDGFGVLAVGGEEFDEVVLGAVGVLVFVYEDVAEAFVPVGEDLGVLLEEFDGEEEEVVEVEGVVGGEGVEVEAVDFGDDAASVVVLVTQEVFGAEALVFGVADGEADGAGFKFLLSRLSLWMTISLMRFWTSDSSKMENCLVQV
jgi:hypothetical protein